MPPDAPLGDFADALADARHFLLAVAQGQVPARLRAKGGTSDLVQDALAAAHAARDQFRGATAAEFRGWVRAILLDRAARFRRRYAAVTRDAGRETALGPATPCPAPCPLAGLARRERAGDLAAAVARLPAPYREVVLLRVEGELGFEEIGRRTGRTPDAARKAFSRALLFLRETVPGPAGGAA